MHRSPFERDHVQETEKIASFGAATILKHINGNFLLVGGSEEDRELAREWAYLFLNAEEVTLPGERGWDSYSVWRRYDPACFSTRQR